MHIYSAKVRLGGKLLNEVQMADITAAEIFVLRGIHGGDAVVEIKHTGTANRSDAKERERLIGSVGDSIPRYREDQYRRIFPTDFSPLPQFLPQTVAEANEEEGANEEISDIVPLEAAPAAPEAPAAKPKTSHLFQKKKPAEPVEEILA